MKINFVFNFGQISSILVMPSHFQTKSAKTTRQDKIQVKNGLLSKMLLPMLFCGLFTANIGKAIAANATDLTLLPLEQLLNLEIYAASKFVQKQSEAPASVKIITAEDIQNFGYRNLADVLRSVPGLYTTNDRNYTYLGVRGFSRAGDYNTRVLLLVDGYRFNDGVFDEAAIGNEFPVDVDLIDRVEVISGPGSALYGNNAFFGVINVITKTGASLNGTELSGELASFGSKKGRLTYGKKLENGMDVLVSATLSDSKGQNLYFQAFDDPLTQGKAHGLDYEKYQQVFAKFSLDSLTFEGVFGNRKKGIPTAAFGQVFGESGSYSTDTYSNISLKYSKILSDNVDVTARLQYGRYEYTGDYIVDYNGTPPYTTNRDETVNQSWSGELRFLSTAFKDHKLVFGAEYRTDPKRDQKNFDIDPYSSYLDDHHSNKTVSVFLQDEYSLNNRTLLNVGVRQDHSSEGGNAFNPRLGLIYKLNPDITTIKLLYGTAFRAANAYERYYATNASNYIASGELKSEKIKTYEIVAEHYLNENTRTTASVFNYKISNLITLQTDINNNLFFDNKGANVKGLELQAEQILGNGSRWHASYSWQLARDEDTNEWLPNSPKNLAKLNYVMPLWGEKWFTGIEVQYESGRRTLQGNDTGSATTANLTLVGKKLAKNLDVSFSIYNLLDRNISDPASEEHFDSQTPARILDVIPQNGRNFRSKLTYTF